MLIVSRALKQEQVRRAVQKAAAAWIEKHGGQSGGAREASRLGTPITQQNLGWASKGEKIGDKMALTVAALYGTDPAGLVAMFDGGLHTIALRSVPGWAKAKAEAMALRGSKIDPWVWRAIDEVTVPARLRTADVNMVVQIAEFLDRWGQGSGTRARIAQER